MNPAELGRQNILQNKLVGNWTASFGLRGVLISMIERAIDEDVRLNKIVLRHFIFGFLFGSPGDQLSSKDLTDANWFALYEWIKPVKDEDNRIWRSDNSSFQLEMSILVDEARSLRDKIHRIEAEILEELGYL